MSIDSKRVSSQGTSFYKAALRCAIQVKNGENSFERLLIPECTCLAFAIELNIKALIYVEGHIPKETHNLRTLFKSLNGKTQKSIITDIGYNESDFEQYLKLIADAFEFWRYVFEQGNFSCNLDILNKLAKACEEKSNLLVN